MGTGFIFQIEDEASEANLNKICDSALEILEDANQRFSLYSSESEISRILRGELDWAKASQQQLHVLEEVVSWKKKTKGFFDARENTPGYDPSGYVKAWATQNAANYLLANGIRKFTINAGGDVYLSPELSSPVLNRVGLSNLRSVADLGAGANIVLDLAGTPFRAVATSGTSERGEHIWRSDESKTYVQVSVISNSLLEADIWATAIVSGGPAAWEVFTSAAHESLVALVTNRTGEIFSSPGFVKLLATL